MEQWGVGCHPDPLQAHNMMLAGILDSTVLKARSAVLVTSRVVFGAVSVPSTSTRSLAQVVVLQ